MCGIAGCQLKRPLTSVDIEQMRAIRDSLSYRGPDGAGEYKEDQNGFYFGHRRLAILDLDPRSNQPMQRGPSIITFNGEIYNFLEVKKDLEPSSRFETSGDTEVLLHGWNQWGANLLNRLEGMYAFALRDQNGLHLVTDAFGEKPLFLYENQDGFYFCSEALPLIKAFQLRYEPTKEQEAEFLNLGFLRAAETGYHGLSSLPPAAHYTIKPDLQLLKRYHWTLATPAGSKQGSAPQPAQSVRNTVRDMLCGALERCLRADVPIGLFLSSGVDSTLLAVLAKRELGLDLQTFTVAFPDGADESRQAAAIAAHLDLPHTIINSRNDASWQDMPESMVNFYGVPNDNTTVLSVYQMCLAAKPHLTVALSGLGADELFYGYNKYEAAYKMRLLYRFSEGLSKLLASLGSMNTRKLKTLQSLINGNKTAQFLRLKNGPLQDKIDRQFHLDAELLETPHPQRDLYQLIRDFDLSHTMPQNLIPSVDRASMRASIEVRSPYLNRQLAEYIAGLDQGLCIAGGKKKILRDILSAYIPLDLLSRTKQGFVFPIDRYFQSIPDDSSFKHSAIYKALQSDSDPHKQRLWLRWLILERLRHG